MLNPLERLSFAAQLQKSLALEIQQILFADRRLVRQRTAGEDVRERPSDDGVVIADAARAPGKVYAELECGEHAFAAHENARPRRRALIAFPHALERMRLGVRKETLAVHRDAVRLVEKTQTPCVCGARRDAREPDRFEHALHERQ